MSVLSRGDSRLLHRNWGELPCCLPTWCSEVSECRNKTGRQVQEQVGMSCLSADGASCSHVRDITPFVEHFPI